MPVPRKRTTKGKQGSRRSHLNLKLMTMAKCIKCGKEIMPHMMCKFCGYYKGQEVVDILGRELRKQEKKKHSAAK